MIAPHHLRIELNGEKSPIVGTIQSLTSSMALNADAATFRAGRSFAQMRGLPMSDNEDHRGSAFDRRTLLRAGLAAAVAAPPASSARRRSRHAPSRPRSISRNFPLCKTSSDAPPLTRRAAQAETVVECRRGLPDAAAGRDRSWLLPEAESRCRARQLFRLDRSIAGGDRDRQDRCRPRHGAALAEAAGAGF